MMLNKHRKLVVPRVIERMMLAKLCLHPSGTCKLEICEGDFGALEIYEHAYFSTGYGAILELADFLAIDG